MRTVTTNGTFDGLHAGHIRFLIEARTYGDYFIILLNSDDSVRSNRGDKSGRPMYSQEDRALMLNAYCDEIIIFNEDTPLEELARIKPHIHIKGGSYEPDRIIKEQQLMKKWGGEFKTLPLIDGYSSGDLINRIIKAYIYNNPQGAVQITKAYVQAERREWELTGG